jgi:hypothetical protein
MGTQTSHLYRDEVLGKEPRGSRRSYRGESWDPMDALYTVTVKATGEQRMAWKYTARKYNKGTRRIRGLCQRLDHRP